MDAADEQQQEGAGRRPATGGLGWRGVAVVAAVAAVVGGAAGGGVVRLAGDGGGRGGGDEPAAAAIAALAADDGDADRVAVVAAAVLPSVVRVDVRSIGSSGNASGAVVDDLGHVVTNHHVIGGATDITVTFADRSAHDAVLVGSDPRNDLAVLRVDADDLPPPIAIAEQAPRVGQLAVVVGSPFGLDGSVTAGIVSAVDRPVDLRVPGGQVVRLPGVLQTDAGVSPGNSGGPLVDASGRMVGVTSAVLAEPFGGGVGFAVPAGVVVDVVDALVRDGTVTHAWLGLAGTTLEAGAAAALDVPAGAVVDRVDAGGPAAEAGIRPGDVVVAVDGQPVARMDDLVAAVRAAGVGATIDLEVVRDGTTRTASPTLVDAERRED